MGELTEKQEEIKRLYYEDNLTQKQISHALEIDQSAISRNLKKIRQITGLHKKTGWVNTKSSKFWRFHALRFTVKPYYFYPRYEKIRASRGNRFIIHRDWKINLHEKSIELILRKGFDFPHEDKFETMRLSEASFNRTLFEIGNKYGFEYQKDGRVAVKCVKQHLANTNSPLARSQKGNFIQVKGYDGRVWFSIDESPKDKPEHEYTHTGRLLDDSETVEPYLDSLLNDLREHRDLSVVGISKRVKKLESAVIEILEHITGNFK